MHSIQIPHHSFLTKLKNKIQKDTKLDKHEFGSPYMQSRRKVLKHMGFSSPYIYDTWIKQQILRINEIQNDPYRIKSLITPTSHSQNKKYYYFNLNIGMLYDTSEYSDNYSFLNINPNSNPIPLLSQWESYENNSLNEIRRPSNDANVEWLHQVYTVEGRDLYIINDIGSFIAWYMCWGGPALLEDHVLASLSIGKKMLAPFIKVNNSPKIITNRI